MGLQSAEEVADVVDVHDDGSVTVSRTLDEMRAGRAPAAQVVEPRDEAQQQRTGTGASKADTSSPTTQSEPAAEAQASAMQTEATGDDQNGLFDETGLIQGIREEIEIAKTPEELDLARSLIRDVADEAVKAELNALASARMRAINDAQAQPASDRQQTPAASAAQRRPRAPISAE